MALKISEETAKNFTKRVQKKESQADGEQRKLHPDKLLHFQQSHENLPNSLIYMVYFIIKHQKTKAVRNSQLVNDERVRQTR